MDTDTYPQDLTALEADDTSTQLTSVYKGDVRIETEADVARFAPLLRGVTKIEGDVDTTCAPITDAQLLDLFGHVQEITGILQMNGNTHLTNLEGLRSVTIVGGGLYIYYNAR